MPWGIVLKIVEKLAVVAISIFTRRAMKEIERDRKVKRIQRKVRKERQKLGTGGRN